MISITYNGKNAIGGFSFILGQGLTPSTGSICFPADNSPVINGQPGSLVINCDGQSIAFSDIYLVNPITVESEDGQVVQATLADKRYRWKYGFLRGKYNQLDQTTGKPKEERVLTDLLDEAFAVFNEKPVYYDIDVLYPVINWEFIEPVAAIEELCKKYSLCVAISPSGQVHISSTTYNKQSFNQTSVSYRERSNNWQLKPRSLVIVGDFMEVINLVDLQPVGVEITGQSDAGTIKPINDLSYKPVEGWAKALTNDFASIYKSNKPWKEAQSLAKQCVFKWYAYIPSDNSIENSREVKLPWLGEYTVKNSVSSEMVRVKPSIFVNCMLFDYSTTKNNVNDNEEPAIEDLDFSLDYKNGILKFKNPVIKKLEGSSNFDPNMIEAAIIKLWIAHKTTPKRLSKGLYGNYYYEKPLGGIMPSFFSKDDSLILYAYEGTVNGMDKQDIYNKTSLDEYCSRLADTIAKKFDTTRPEQYTFEEILNVTPIGELKSVSWRVDENGWNTVISMGQEEIEPFLPSYNERIGITKTTALHWPMSQLNTEKLNKTEVLERT